MDVTFEKSKHFGKDEWLTPPEIIRALGKFDLDPCAPIVRPWDTAAKHYTVVRVKKRIRIYLNKHGNTIKPKIHIIGKHGH